MSTVYLAGMIGTLDFAQAAEWRDYVTQSLAEMGIKGISPMRAKEYLKDTGTIDASNLIEGLLSTDRAVITRDYFDVTHADIVLVNLLGAQRVSIGTMMEIGFAYSHRIPVVLVIEKSGNCHEHPFLRETVGFRVETLEEGIHIVKSILSAY